MRGLMMDMPLSISGLIEYAADLHGTRTITSKRLEGDLHRYTYREARDRIAQLAHALQALGIGECDRVATIAWNGYRHFELYYAVPSIGAVYHTINPRLHPDQLIYIVNHAENRYLFVDLTFVPLVEALIDHLPTLEGVVIMTDRAHMPETKLANVLCYEELFEGQPTEIEWPVFDENQAAGLCYTSGTTGNPKGVLYSHRSNVLHALATCMTVSSALGEDNILLPVVPLFHANAWVLPYVAPITGTDLVMPGAALDGASVFDMMDEEGVTVAFGVPTVWLWLLAEMEKRGAKPGKLSMIGVGGSAAPRPMIETFEKKYGIEVVHGWGMTEMSPIGTLGHLSAEMNELPFDERIDIKARQGRRMWGVEMKIVDEEGKRLPHDGKASGELLVRGPCVTSGYYNDEAATAAAFDDEGWFRTGDIAAIDGQGFLFVVDRTKDIIKSGGEWISSIDLENAAVGHPDVALAAVIGLPHPEWGERPLLILVAREGAEVKGEEVCTYLADKVAKWWLPDDVVFLDELPLTATGKVRKATLREQFKDYVLPTVG